MPGSGISDAALEAYDRRSKPPNPAVPFPPLHTAWTPERFWPSEISREEISQAKRIADEVRLLDAALASEIDHLSFLATCRRAILGDRISMESATFERLTFGAFTVEEKLARISNAETEAKKRQSDLGSRKQKLQQDLAKRAQAIQAAINKAGIEQRLDQCMLAAESASRAMDAIAEAAAGVPIIATLRGYSFFAGGTRTPFQDERAKNGATK
jgi:hypothetical protein